MIELPVYDSKGKQVDTFSVDEALLGGEIRPALLKQAYVRAHANQRQGSARTRNRSRVEGSTRKLFKQKGTGNARRGPVRTNVMKGGGVAFAKTRTGEDFRRDMPRKMRRLANRNALLAKAVDQEIKIIDKIDFKAPRTAEFKSLLEKVGIDRSCLVALDSGNVNARRSARNLDGVDTIRWEQLNAFEMLNHRYLVIEKANLKAFIENGHCTGGGNGGATTAKGGR